MDQIVISPGPSPVQSGTLMGMNILLEGPSGSGKTTSLKTLLNVPGLEVFALFLEPRFDVLGKDVLDKIHWRYIEPVKAGWSTLIHSAKSVSSFSNESLQKMHGIDKEKCTQFITILQQFENFVDVKGDSFGNISDWGTNRVLVVDGLTGLSKAARGLTAGLKPILTQPDWGVAMQTILGLVDELSNTTKCHLILIAHVERESDELTGITKLMTSTLGRKLAPQIPINFSDVILTNREGANFYWDTASSQADLKPGNLPINAKNKADFVPLFESWKKKGGVLAP